MSAREMTQFVLNYLQAVDADGLISATLLLAVPMTYCLLFWLGAPSVKSTRRRIVTFVLLSALGWFMSVSGGRQILHDDGICIVAIVLGWALPWVYGLPIIVMSSFLHALLRLRRRLCRGTTAQDASFVTPRRFIAVVLFVTMAVCAVIMGINPRAVWRNWGNRQYRTVNVDGFVHVQVREAGKVSDVATDASAYYRYEIVPIGDECLRLDSVYISGVNLIHKVGGEWMWKP